MKFKKGLHVHLVGISGVGMTALAGILKDRGLIVTGSDVLNEKFITDKVLAKYKIPVLEFSKENITDNIDIVVSSAAYYFQGKARNNHEEVKEVLKTNLPIMTYPEALGILAKDYKVIALAGSHGKSTTTAMLGWVLEQNGIDPTVLVGTMVKKWNSNARSGKGKYLVVEADEYRDAFLNYKPYGLVVTSVDHDHPDYFKTKADYIRSFVKLVKQMDPKGWFIGCELYPEVIKLAKEAKKRKIKTSLYGKKLEKFKLKFPGKTYQLNALATARAAEKLGVSSLGIKKALSTFPGTKRRFDTLKKTKTYTIIHDYAHHPTAVQMTLEGAREFYPKKKVAAIFQPHTFSRTKLFLDEFANSFYFADEVRIMPVYASAREKKGKIGSRELVKQAKKYHEKVEYLSGDKETKKYIRSQSKNGNIIFLMGAGDINNLV